MQKEIPNEYHLLKPDAGTIIILGSGLTAQRWRQKLLTAYDCHSARGQLIDIKELPALLKTVNPQVLLWQTNVVPSQLVRSLEKVPREIPILLRYPHSICPEKNLRLYKLLNRRASQIKRSFPLRFWPPLCRVREVVASNAPGPAHEIKIILTSDYVFTDTETKRQKFILPDLFDLCSCLMNNSAAAIKSGQTKGDNLYTLEFPGERKAVIKKEARSSEIPSGIVEIRVDCKLAKINLKFNPVDRAWQMERSFAQKVNSKPHPLLRLPDHDPVELEIKWFLRDKFPSASSMNFPANPP